MNDRGLGPALRQLAASGFRSAELVCEAPHFTPDGYDVTGVRRMLDESGIAVPSAHGPFKTVDCGALDEADRKQAVAMITPFIRPLVELGVRFMVLHPNIRNKLAMTPDGYRRSRAQTRRSLQELADAAGEAGLKIAVENMHSKGNKPRPGVTIEQLHELIADLGEHMGMCLDTGHAAFMHHLRKEFSPGGSHYDNATDELLAMVDAAGDRLFSLHLQDTDGQRDRHWVPGRGVIDWSRFIARLDQMGFPGPRTVEASAVFAPEGVSNLDLLGQCCEVAMKWTDHGRD